MILLSNSLFSQTGPKQCSCCDPEYRQFNFWLGDWEVFNLKGEMIGENNIISMQDSCVLQENWTSDGQTGTSYSFYNKQDSSWNQIYIDNLGNVLQLKGTVQDNKMILKSEKMKSVKADFYYINVITWVKDSLGNVSQKWDIVDDKGTLLQVAFDGIYKRKITSENLSNMKKVTGIGGIFFKCKDPNAMKEWYKSHLGLETDEYGTSFEWRQGADSSKYGFTQWSPFSENTKYFEPSTKEFMINYRVENLESLVEQLKKEGVTILDEIESFDYGKFIHILDIEGNKIELWEPVDIEYNKIVVGRTK
jgi:predicted enzyme related to lactoylglutathione lyase